MKATINGICLFMTLTLMACGGGGGGGDASTTQTSRALTEGETQSGFIATAGEVDTYQLTAAETNRFLHLHCTEATSGSEVDLLVTVYEEVNGERVRLFGKHKPDGATLSADLDLWIYVDTPKELYITVRDFMDDDSSTTIPYRLTYTYQDSAEGNHDFSTARSLAIGSDNAMSDAIEDIGEVDCFTFAPQADGVYAIDVAHHIPIGGSPVQLAVSLYDRNGNRIQRLAEPHHTILTYLEQSGGPYFVIVEDNDSMDGDSSAPYDIRVEAVAASEARDNDEAAAATVIASDGVDGYTAAGAIDYGCSSVSPGHFADADWYRLFIGEQSGATTYHQIELTIDNGDTIKGTAPLRVTVADANLETVTSHDFTSGGEAYRNQFRVENGEYYISVVPANSQRLDRSATYRVALREATSTDTVEETDDNTINSAIALGDQDPVEGYVSYHADVDWYAMEVNTASAAVLAVDLTTAEASIVDYHLSIWRGDQMITKRTDMDGSDGPTHLKTAILIPAEDPPTVATYYVKVCDAQNNEGSSSAYTLTADVEPVAGAPGGIAQTAGQPLYYYDEVNQEANETAEVELEIFSTHQPHFKANTDWLDFRNNPHVTYTAQGDATQIRFPWISGYIDYQGDRDLFRLDFDKLDPAGTETSWYYDVEIRLVVSSGSDVEYVWKLYRDSNNNAIVMDDPTSPDGYIACAGDTTPLVMESLDLTTPTGDETFWVGSEWGQGATFYIGMSDFNYLLLPEDESPNSEPDDDWGYDAPYYFTLTLTYHPGQATPD
jgi:hypothetical protein